MTDAVRDTRAASPAETFWYTSAITVVLLIAASTLPWYRCGPFHGILAALLATVIVPWLVLPALAVPGGVAVLAARLLHRSGSRRTWRRALLACVGVLIVVLALATVAPLVAPGAQNCDLS